MKPHIAFAFGLALLASPLPAHASGGFSCTAEDANMKLEVASAVSHGLGGVFTNFNGAATVLLAGAPEDLRAIDLGKGLVHHWIDRGDLRLSFYSERGEGKPHAYVDLMLKTAGDPDEGEFQGTYALTVFTMDPPADAAGGKIMTAEGKAVCLVE
jgi:hypothetical protein